MFSAIGLRLGTLRHRLFLLLASASVVAVVGVNLIWLPGTLRDVHAARSELELVAVRGVRDQIDFFLADKEQAVTTIAQLFRAAVIDGDPKGVAVVGQRFLARERAFEEVGIFEPPRTWRYRLSRREVMTIASSDAPPALDGGLDVRGVAWGAVTTTETSEPWVTIATPLSGAVGPVLVVGVLNLKDLWSLIADVRLGERGRAYVVDRRGGLIAADDVNLVLKRLSLTNRPIVKRLLEQDHPDGVTGAYTNERGVEVMATGLRVERAGWGVVVEHPRAVVAAAVGQKLWFFAALTVAGVLVSAGAAHVLSARLTGPLERLRQGVQRFGRGELDHRVPIETADEIGELAQQFNQMATELGASHARLEERIRDATRDLARRQREAEELARVARTLTEDLDVHQVSAACLAGKQTPEEVVQCLEVSAVRPGVGRDAGGRVAHTRSSRTRVPEETALKTVASPWIRPRIFTALAARGFSSVLAGVRPKKMQKAPPGGQYPSSPTVTISRASFSCLASTGMGK
jgi:HAMP domain-containing protein